jgi:hypothetical protein
MTSVRFRRAVAVLSAAAWIAVVAPTAGAQTKPGDPTPIDFWKIAYYDYNPREPFEPMPTKAQNTIPADVRKLDGQKVAIAGIGMALDYSSGATSEFILQASVDACGFGAMPRINEWIYVKMAGGKKTPVYTAMEMVVTGTFRIREEVEDGRVVGLYSIEADRVQ